MGKAGQLSFPFLIAQGFVPGNAVVSDEMVKIAERMMTEAHANKWDINTPVDFTVADKVTFEKLSRGERFVFPPPLQNVKKDELTPDQVICDIGTVTRWSWSDSFGPVRTIFWHGPLGVGEVEPFAAGTREVARALIDTMSPRFQRSIVSGDSLSSAIQTFDLPFERIRHLTTGGESVLQVLAGNPLPAVAALDNGFDLIAPTQRRPRKMLLAVDGSEHSVEAARRIGRLVNAEGAEIRLLYVQKPQPFVTEETWVDPEEKRQREIERRFEAERVFATVNAALARQGLISHRQMAVEGDPASKILELADEVGVDLIAMGSHGKSGVLSLLMGSVSRKVIDHAKRPVLIVRMPDREMVKAGLIEA